ncbi:MAG: branched-chain amino acid ABC transporter permease [Atopobiaceae bacterium]|jgi:branched-chain amino acid transport system permease protein|nr:branched-chain amino acid ABC transporter permease [Atopobiaceae bacterium]MCI2172941.1 branched-chain amino acid ABC transporter permease [Atopobiaceae bacterium]MCI2208346.1 branched-chain amino acid ABC transporter permease [Atopobiaceae bacterium]
MFKSMSKSARSTFTTYAMVVVAYVIVQILANGGMITNSLTGQLVPICAYICLAVSLNLVVGISGELSLGHAGFMSVGAFAGVVAAACFSSSVPNDALRLILSIAVGGGCAAIAGFVVGIPVMRLHGDYLAIVTLAFGEIIKNIMNNLYVGLDSAGLHFSMTDANSLGMSGGTILINGPQGAVGIEKLSTFFAGFILVIFCLFVVLNLIHSRSGRAIMAVRDNRIAAESVGINVTKYRLMAFVISAALAGMAGALYAMNYSSIVPKKFDFNTSILILVFVVLGGMGNIRGSVISATILTILPEMLRAISDYRMLIYAIVLILVMLVSNNPTLKGAWANLRSRLRGRRGRPKVAAAEAAGDAPEGGDSDE